MNRQQRLSGFRGTWLSIGLSAILALLNPLDCKIAQALEARETIRTVIDSLESLGPSLTTGSTGLTVDTLHVWSNGTLESQPSPSSGWRQISYFAPCAKVERFTGSLIGDMAGTSYGLSGTFEFTPSFSLVVYFRIILVHQGVEQVLTEYPLNLNAGKQVFTGFTQTGPDPVATFGDAIILEIDPRGLIGFWTMNFGGTSGAKLSIPESPMARPANFSQNIFDDTFSPLGSVYPVDLDGDGDMDIVTTDGWKGNLVWWENSGNQNYVKQIIDSNISFNGHNPAALFAADLDRDGDMDLLAATGWDVIWWENSGGNTFTRQTLNPVINPKIVIAVDLDKEGDMDIMVAGYELAWLENNGQQQFTKHFIAYSNDEAMVVVDLNKDGYLDIVTASSNGAITWWKNNAAHSFSKQTILAGGDITTTGGSIFAADLDLDGDIDIIASPTLSGTISWWENDGHENFTRHIIPVGFGTSSLFVFDMDSDGDMDIIAGGAWFENTGGQNFIRHSYSDIQAVKVADLDKDGKMDMVRLKSWWQNQGTEPLPDIKANGSDGPITIRTADNLSVAIKLSPGDFPGYNADWWVLADASPFGWYYYNANTGSWSPGLLVTYQGALFNLPSYGVLNATGLPTGTYTFYFAVDMNVNGSIDMGAIYYDSVEITITP